MKINDFTSRQVGPRPADVEKMLKVIGVSSMEELVDKTVPAAIRLPQPLNLPKGMSEYEFLNHVRALAAKNKLYKTYIGMGYYNTVVPAVIQRVICFGQFRVRGVRLLEPRHPRQPDCAGRGAGAYL